MNLTSRLEGHFLACSAVAAVAATGAFTQNAEAQIVHSGIVNINIPSTTAGVYLNVVTGLTGASSGATPGWDVNPWSSTTLNFFNPSAPTGGVYVRTDESVAGVSNLPFNTMIGSTNFYASGAAQLSGANPFNLNSDQNLVGFRFLNEANNEVHYGWMRIAISDPLSAQPRSIVEYAFEATPGAGIGAGIIPAPGSLALLALGAVGLAGRRRK